jgi:hypothetical protein
MIETHFLVMWLVAFELPAADRQAFEHRSGHYLFPDFSKAFFRGSHTNTFVTCGRSKSCNQAAVCIQNGHGDRCLVNIEANILALFMRVLLSV